MIREGLRHMMWRRAANRRLDMQGLDEGVDRDATMALLSRRSLSNEVRGALRTIVTGDVWSQDRLHRAGLVAKARCKFCNTEAEDIEHIWWKCPQWDAIRKCHPISVANGNVPMPRCMRLCGIATDSVKVVGCMSPQKAETHIDLTSGEAVELISDSERESAGTEVVEDWRRRESIQHGRIVVFTDGACRDNQLRSIRRAGFGAYWCDGHAKNFAAPLVGEVQTNQRAELMAVVRVVELEERPLEIRTDSMYVIQGFNGGLRRWPLNGWRTRRREVSNKDLWQRLSTLLAQRRAEVCVTKVKGHASWRAIILGEVTEFDKLGNDRADALAVAGAALHNVSRSARSEQVARHSATQDLQWMMVDILLARRALQRQMKDQSSTSTSSDDDESFSTQGSNSPEISELEPD
eukprot:5262749-Karenia_brevis.AAC.1